jgi:phospholipid transport system substrate-binding protein
VQWRVASKDGEHRITDVVVENVSLSQTWRSDFAATMQQGGGMAGLLAAIGERVAALKRDLGIAA